MTEVVADTGEKIPHRTFVFWLGILAMFNCGVAASARAAIAGDLKSTYLDALDIANSAKMIGEALGIFFLGFTLALFACSFTLDKIGMKRMLQLGGILFIVSTLLLYSLGSFHGDAVYHAILAAMFINGLGHACVEGTVNPMVASLYSNNTTHRMNQLHAWYPGGIILGGLYGAFAPAIGLSWQIVFLPVALFGLAVLILSFGRQFPRTSSQNMGIPIGDQFREMFRRPTFFLWCLLMLFTAASEVAPVQWVDVALSNVVGMRGILLVSYVSGIQFIGRHFAGPLEKALSVEGLMTVSCFLAAVGLFLLGVSHNPVMAFISATAWGLGVIFLWPTMLAVGAKRYPRGGAVTIGILGAMGNLSIYFILPLLGSIYDKAKLAKAGGEAAFAALTPEQAKPILVYAAGESFRLVSIIPAALVVIFGVMWFLYKSGRPVGGAGQSRQ
jgi:fucose permease